MSLEVKGTQTREGMAFTRLCERADTDPEARAEVEREIAERMRVARAAALARKAAVRPRHSQYDRCSES